jgi:hypothetical protein
MMTTAVSFYQPFVQTCSVPCNWISDICKRVYDLAMKMITAIKDCFATRQSLTTGTTITPLNTRITIPDPKNVIPFYRGLEANNNHATLNQILSWDDGQLEMVHDYIQWLFPLETPSNFNPTAPVIDQATIQTFRNDSLLKSQLLRSFCRMLTFYGLQMDVTTRVITRAPNFNLRAAVWLTSGNHNFQRITRIIHSLSLLGLPEYSRAFLTVMQNIASNEGSRVVGSETVGYWQRSYTAPA